MKTALRRAFPDTDAEKLDKLERYAAMLIEQNRSMNLTAITDTEGIVQKHFADSLAALPYLPKGARCIDVGTGAGFPGVPLQILREDIRVTLLDATKKEAGISRGGLP